MIDLFTSDFIGLNNEQRHSAIVDFVSAQPTESNRHDYKLIWNNDAIKDVAAFANTFGGILLIGVEKNKADARPKVSGVSSSSELTTGIASAIATNISPTPSYDIMECHKPGETNTRFCAVRVRSDYTLYLVTKKDVSHPVWIRNADETIRADAAQLRRLIDREKSLISNSSGALANRAQALLDEMIIGKNYAADLSTWPAGSWHRSENYFKIALLPTELRALRIDGRTEDRFNKLIFQHYRRIQTTLSGSMPAAAQAHNRSGNFYEYRWYHKKLDIESRWRITDAAEIAHSVQIKHDEYWSLADVVFYLILLLRIAAKWWESLNYYGDGLVFTELKIQNLPVFRGSVGQFLTLFNPAGGDFGMGAETVNVHTQQREEAKAYLEVTFSTMRERVPLIATSLMNLLLRSLGHNVFWTEFEDNVRTLVQGTM